MQAHRKRNEKVSKDTAESLEKINETIKAVE